MTSLFLGAVLSLLPKRYRERLPAGARADLRHGAILSGVVVGAVCLVLFILRYLAFLQYRVADLGGRAIDKGAEGVLVNRVVHFGMGAVSLFEYMLHPITILLLYFAVEGVVRAFAALVTEETVGTLPLYGVAWVEDRLGKARAERALGARVPDIVEEVYSPEYDARILSCRRRKWDRMTTLSWKDQFYEVLGEQPGRPPYHFVYRLRKSPKGRVIRTLHQYDPEELMKEAPAKPGFLAWLAGFAQDKLAEIRAESAPLLPDIVDTMYGKEFQLRIASQRPKEGWDHLITIECQGKHYEVFRQVGGTSVYPYVYLLRDLPPGKIIRTVQHYEPVKLAEDHTP